MVTYRVLRTGIENSFVAAGGGDRGLQKPCNGEQPVTKEPFIGGV